MKIQQSKSHSHCCYLIVRRRGGERRQDREHGKKLPGSTHLHNEFMRLTLLLDSDDFYELRIGMSGKQVACQSLI
jgi:hypothetical protein